MQGFCTEGVLLFPSIKAFEDKPLSYLNQFEKGISNIIKLFQRNAIQLYGLMTDEVALTVRRPEGLGWIEAIPPEDGYFIRTNCVQLGNNIQGVKHYPDIAREVKAKLPLEQGCTRDERFELVERRTKLANKLLFKEMKCIVHVCFKSNLEYSIKPKESDNTLFMIVDAKTWLLDTYINGQAIDPVKLLGLPYATMGINKWGTYDEYFN